jgi:hypothetical protein
LSFFEDFYGVRLIELPDVKVMIFLEHYCKIIIKLFKPTQIPKWISNRQMIKVRKCTEAVQERAFFLNLFRPCSNGKMVATLSTFQAASMVGILEFQCMEGMDDYGRTIRKVMGGGGFF